MIDGRGTQPTERTRERKACFAPMMTIEEVGERLSVGKSTVLRLIRRGALRASKIGKQWRTRAEDLDAFIKTHTPLTLQSHAHSSGRDRRNHT